MTLEFTRLSVIGTRYYQMCFDSSKIQLFRMTAWCNYLHKWMEILEDLRRRLNDAKSRNVAWRKYIATFVKS
jgi:hypothetical protein